MTPRRPADDAELLFWLRNMAWYHRYTEAEMVAATGLSAEEIRAACARGGIDPTHRPPREPGAPLLLLPYPGGRHPRLGFREGALDPQRDTKFSLFTPWDEASYVVVDLPEAIFCNLGLIYLAHTHLPTLWSERGIALPPVEWDRSLPHVLASQRTLPNGIAFGAHAVASERSVKMELWLHNGTDTPLRQLRAQVCVLLGRARGFDAQTNENKRLEPPRAICLGLGARRIVTEWQPLHRVWANPACPCLHADPRLPDCPPGETVRATGWLEFAE